MRWVGRRASGNVEDRRFSGGRIATGGGIVGVIIYLLVQFLGGGDSSIQNLPINMGGGRQLTEVEQQAENERAEFVKVVLAETEDVWNKLFDQQGKEYVEPTLVLYRGYVESACGTSSSASGPFYCPPDQKVYIDLSFYEELQARFHAPGDFAMAYVIAHEVGHHVQNLLGITQQMEQMQGRVSQQEYNRYSVKVELQADFFAGVWAHHMQAMDTLLEQGDIEEALNAARAVGDDMIQKQTQGRIVPDAFTHGSSEQRMYWFKKGWDTGDINQGNTFANLLRQFANLAESY